MTSHPPQTALAAAHREWHRDRLAKLCAADGWLSLVDLVWLDDGNYSLGSAADCAVRLPAGPARLGELRIAGGGAQWQPADGPGAAHPLQTDRDGTPDVIRHGTLSFFLIERDGALALRLRNELAPSRLEFAGIELFPFDPSWQLNARWDGRRAHFEHAGQALELTPLNSQAATWQFVFSDATSGRASYGGGRFLFAEAAQDGRLRLDFNRAINPPCAFTPFAVCPLPPPENRLPLAVEAGEKSYRGKH